MTIAIYFGENQAPAYVVSGNPLIARTTFLSKLNGVSSVGFQQADGCFLGDTAPEIITFTGSGGSTITATITGTGTIAKGTSDGRWNTTPGFSAQAGQYWAANGTFAVGFDNPISAFGFYGTDVGDFNGQLTITLTAVNNSTTTYTVNNTVNGANAALLFWGFIDTSVKYKSISFGNTSSGFDTFGFDDMIVGDIGQVIIPTGQQLMLFSEIE